MEEQVLKITPEGGILCVYSDDLPFLGKGKDTASLTLTRASNVRWDEEKQEWRIFMNTPEGEEEVPMGFTRRDNAIKFEVHLLNIGLADGTYDVESLFAPRGTEGCSVGKDQRDCAISCEECMAFDEDEKERMQSNGREKTFIF